MLQAMFSGVSGLQAHQTKLNVSGNNIANVNTIGFKAGRVTFQDQLSQTLRASARPSSNVGGQNPSQVGLGVTLGAVDTLQTQGNLQTTGKPTDLAIQGNGFFLVSSGDNVFYTRDGSFDLDSNGVMVNPASGLKLLGYIADQDGQIDTSQQVTKDSVVTVPVGTLTSVKQTTASTFQGNLNANAALQSTLATLAGQLDLSTGASLTHTVYDSQGNAHTLVTNFTRDDPNPPPAGGAVPAGAVQRWSLAMSLDGVAMPNQTIYGVPRSPASDGTRFIFTNSTGVESGSTLAITVPGIGTAPAFPLTVDFGAINAKSNISGIVNGQGGSQPSQSTLLTLKGNLNSSGPTPTISPITVYKSDGTAFEVNVNLTNPVFNPGAGANVPTGALQQWDVAITRQQIPGGPVTTIYNGDGTNQSRLYFVPGSGFVLADGASPANTLGPTISLSAGALPGTNLGQGQQIDTNFPLTVDFSTLTTTKIAATADGQTGPAPVWNTSLRVFDSLGVGHLLNFKFSRALVGSGAPGKATARWEWEATINGNSVASSQQPPFKAMFFDSSGNLINKEKQTVEITPKSGAAPFEVAIDFQSLTQLAGDSSVAAITQDGFPVGTLQSFSISQEGIITGIFSNGQTRTLGQVATANFSNPSGMEKIGQNLFRESGNSGLAQVGPPGVAGRGRISTGFVEMSNVDLSTEFTNLIVTQRGFQANTRIITIVDDLLQDVINLKR